MRQHPDQLFRVEARIDRVDNSTNAGDRIIQLEMAVRVPGDRRNDITIFDSQIIQQRIGELFGSLVCSGITLAVGFSAFRQTRNNFSVAMAFGGVDKNVRNHQRTIHHVCAHRSQSPLRTTGWTFYSFLYQRPSAPAAQSLCAKRIYCLSISASAAGRIRVECSVGF